MQSNIPASEPIPGIPVPNEQEPIIVPPGPVQPIEIDEPQPVGPSFPVREPGIQSPPQLVHY